MNVHDLLSHDSRGDPPGEGHMHQYRTRHSFGMLPGTTMESSLEPYSELAAKKEHDLPMCAGPKNITFELLFADDARFRARLPMKVQIWQHDSTDNIVSAVRNFFGLYDNAIKGVNFEDGNGTTLIASHDNLTTGMTVYVRIVSDGSQAMPRSPLVDHQYLDQNYQPAGRTTRRTSTSPRVNHTLHFGPLAKSKGRRAGSKACESTSFQARLEELNSEHSKHGSSDGEEASVSSSFKARNELLASAEISVENIVAGGRRQRAKFESSVPVANSISSVSPQRRVNGPDASPYIYQPPGYFARTHPWPSPMQSATGMTVSSSDSKALGDSAPHGHRLRERVSVPLQVPNARSGVLSKGLGLGILPTPDPTVASTISDEDVALQLMRLADPSTLSHGRASASTLDDSLSRRADHASSESSDTDVQTPAHNSTTKARTRSLKRPRSMANVSDHGKRPKHGLSLHDVESKSKKSGKLSKSRLPSKPHRTCDDDDDAAHGCAQIQPSACLMGPPPSSTNGDEDDLSSKPRCQRCRKSKKGCDRQRPCQRCKDAGIGVDGCISEDEHNGRKGRFGRHMGVSVAKEPSLQLNRDLDQPLHGATEMVDFSKRRKR